MLKKILAAIVATALILIGCSSEPIYITQELHLPARPVLPVIKGDELKCLSDATYSKLSKRQLLLKHYIEELELVISSTAKDNE